MRLAYGAKGFHVGDLSTEFTDPAGYFDNDQTAGDDFGDIDPATWFHNAEKLGTFKPAEAIRCAMVVENSIEARDWFPSCVLLLYLRNFLPRSAMGSAGDLVDKFSKLAECHKNKRGEDAYGGRENNEAYLGRYMTDAAA